MFTGGTIWLLTHGQIVAAVVFPYMVRQQILLPGHCDSGGNWLELLEGGSIPFGSPWPLSGAKIERAPHISPLTGGKLAGVKRRCSTPRKELYKVAQLGALVNPSFFCRGGFPY